MDAERAPIPVRKHLKVAARLRRLDYSKREFLTGYFKIRRVRTGDLQEDPGVWPSFVGLPGGVKEAGTKTEAGGDPSPIPNRSKR